jgi:endoglucanase
MTLGLLLAGAALSLRGGDGASWTETLTEQEGAIVRGSRDQRRLAVVFAAHEFAEGGPAILDALATRHAHASFFLTGAFLDDPAFTPLVSRIVQDGHYVGPHSDQHLLYCDWGPSRRTRVSRAAFETDLRENLAKIARLGVVPDSIRFFLPPYEHANAEIAAWTRDAGLTLVNLTPGTRSAADYTTEEDPGFTSSTVIRESILQRGREDPAGLNGWILLFHLGAGLRRTDAMAPHLASLFDALKARGYELVRLDELLLPAPSARLPILRLSQLGYRPADRKMALAFATAPFDSRFDLIDAATGEAVWQGSGTSLPGASWGRFAHHVQLEFSGLSRPGRYRLRLGCVESPAFPIGEGIFDELPSQLLEFIRQQRCGNNPWLGAECHAWDGRTACGPRPAGTPLDARGGWHDAADLLKYLLTSGNATAQMLLAWELHRSATGDTAEARREALFPDRVDATGRPGTNGVPDVLDEARWGLEWMLKLHPTPGELYHQVADDRDHCGWRLPPDDRADYGWGPGSNRVVYAAEGRPQGLGRYLSDSTGRANLAGRYAAAMALAASIWKDDPTQAGFARRCLQAAREVYALGRQSEGVQQGNSFSAPYRYAEATWADDMEWGAAELFRATGEPLYLEDARRYARRAAATSWMGREQTAHYEFYPFINVGHYRLHGLVEARFQRKLAAYYRQGLERCREASAHNPYGIGVPFIWCSNHLLVALVTQCQFYRAMTGDSHFDTLAAHHRDWLLGRNPWGTTLVTGVGLRFPRNPHLMTTRLTGRAVPGGLVDGPVRASIFGSLKGVSLALPDALADFQDPRATYHDDLQDYATNEPTLDGTASALLLWSVLEMQSRSP